MYAMHDALRRELRHIADTAARADGDPREILRTAPGWDLFKTALRAHQQAEDAALWPVLRTALAGRPYDLAVLEALEAEHAGLDPLLAAIDEATADDSGPDLLVDLVGALVAGLRGHLRHEEEAALPLIRAAMSGRQRARFARAHAERIAPDACRILPWLLDDADEHTATALLAALPRSARRAYRQWQAAYAALDRWSGRAPAKPAATAPAGTGRTDSTRPPRRSLPEPARHAPIDPVTPDPPTHLSAPRTGRHQVDDDPQRRRDVAAIRRLVARVEEYRNDPARFIPLHTPDVSVVNFNGRRVGDRVTLERTMTRASTSPPADVSSRTSIHDIRFIGSDVAIVACVEHVFDNRYAPLREGPDTRLPARTGQVTYVLARRPGAGADRTPGAGGEPEAESGWLISSAQTTLMAI